MAYIVGEFVNAAVMVILKNRTQGRMLWLRTISSTVVGQGIDSLLFFTIAFGFSGFWVGEDGSWAPVFNAALCAWIAKSVYEIAATPLTYLVVGWLKRTEDMDAYDAPRSLNPFGVFGGGPDVNAATASARRLVRLMCVRGDGPDPHPDPIPEGEGSDERRFAPLGNLRGSGLPWQLWAAAIVSNIWRRVLPPRSCCGNLGQPGC